MEYQKVPDFQTIEAALSRLRQSSQKLKDAVRKAQEEAAWRERQKDHLYAEIAMKDEWDELHPEMW